MVSLEPVPGRVCSLSLCQRVSIVLLSLKWRSEWRIFPDLGPETLAKKQFTMTFSALWLLFQRPITAFSGSFHCHFFLLLVSSPFAITSSHTLQLMHLSTSPLTHYLLPQLPSLRCSAKACWLQESYQEQNTWQDYFSWTVSSRRHFSFALGDELFFFLLQHH